MWTIPGWVWFLTAALLGLMTFGSVAVVAKRNVLFDAGKMLFGA